MGISLERLIQIRDEEGYDGPLDQDGNRVDPLDPRAEICDALRRAGA